MSAAAAAATLPPSLTPGPSNGQRASPNPITSPDMHPAPLRTINAGGFGGSSSYEDLHPGARSPAESERSNFTSVSQRGINPRWNPALGPGGYGSPPGGPMSRRPVPDRRERDLLANNPDFDLPVGRGGRGMGGAARGRGVGGPYPGGL
jgi:hypothetical protein